MTIFIERYSYAASSPEGWLSALATCSMSPPTICQLWNASSISQLRTLCSVIMKSSVDSPMALK